jgi:hypothetical protein
MASPFDPLVFGWKEIASSVEWSSPADPEDGHVAFLVPLEIDGVTIAEFALRGGAYEQHADKAVMFQLEIGSLGVRTRTPLVRLDWRPLNPIHKNPDKVLISGSHVHRFEANWLESEQRMRTGNLPVAEKIAEIHTFTELLDFAKILFRINNIEQIPVPEWSPKLI